MKKGLFLVMLLVAAVAAKAEVEFAYTAGAELTSAYIWRGQYNGGLSFQPDLEVGFETGNTAFSAGVWANIGSSDWMFRKGRPDITTEDGETLNPNTVFKPELDVVLSYSFYGANIGLNHYYYCDGSNFFSWKSVDALLEAKEDGQTTTEVWAGYNFGDQLGIGLYINWYTTIAGYDFVWDEDGNAKRAWSSYLELGYDYSFENIGLTIGAQLGISPWASDLYCNEKFAVTNISARIEKEFDFDVCTLNVFATGSINPDGINKDNVYINKAGEEKLYNQKLNGAIGVGVWF
jgi:hypothetical protein